MMIRCTVAFVKIGIFRWGMIHWSRNVMKTRRITPVVVVLAAFFAVLYAVRHTATTPSGSLESSERPRSVAGNRPATGPQTGGAVALPSVTGATSASGATHRPVLQGIYKPAASPAGPLYTRARLVKGSGKYAVHRIEERWEKDDSPSGHDRLLSEVAMVGDHVMVQLREGRSRADLEKILLRHGFILRSALQVPRGFLVAVETADPGSVPELVRLLSAEPAVGIVEPDYVYTLAETRPDDAIYPSQWGMEKIGMPRVWDATTGTGGVVVAVFDTGVDLTHPDLVDNLWTNPGEIDGNGLDDDNNGYIDDYVGWDFYDNNNDPSDEYGHGSHVAGTIGAVGNNSIGVVGVGWHVRILPIKFFGYNSSGVLEGYASDAASGMYYVMFLASRGVPVRVTNHSWGGSGDSFVLKEAFRIAAQYGLLNVAAAGNGYVERDNDIYPHYPSGYDLSNIVAVANTTQADGLSASSYYGATSVDLGAPGESIWSTVPGGGFGVKSGTSMATPHVAGAAALLFDMFPELTWQDVRELLLAGVDPLPALSGLCVTGGRLNVYNSFAMLPMEIRHEPLQNTASENVDCLVDAWVRPGLSFVNTNRIEVLWNTTGSTNVFESTMMTSAGGERFVASLPGMPKGTSIYYMIRVESLSGSVSTHPAEAPAALHRFDVTYPVSLSVYGYPQNVGDVSPAYGAGNLPWGALVNASAPAYTDAVDGKRWRCSGWDGAGSVPPFGSTNGVVFPLKETSFLLWWWCAQVAVTQSSVPSGVLSKESWFDTGDVGSSIEAPAVATVDSVQLAFIGWQVDGARFPDDVSAAVNPASFGITDQPLTSVAMYIPAQQDQDTDGLPDWWELFYFNHLDYDSLSDPDGDGFANTAEFSDRSSPVSSGSVPEGPEIDHTPLDSPLGLLSPWKIEAAVTDRVGVAVVLLDWQRNGGAWNEVRMTLTGGRYSANIPSPDAPGDMFAYRIVAADAAMNTSTSSVYSFDVSYPLLAYQPAQAALSVEYGKSTALRVTMTNAGSANLSWESVESLAESVSEDAGGWTHGGSNDQWHISTRQAFSAPYSWFCGDENGGEYHNLMDAVLDTPPVVLGGAPMLRFQHWAEMEYDGSPGFENYFWDGAVVEISRDGGQTFDSIAPVGGYPYRIVPNPDSPFEANRPCLGGVTGGWQEVSFDLAEYTGETVHVRFRFGSDGYVQKRGWFIDDILLTWAQPWLIAPAGGSVPAGGSAVVELLLDAAACPPGAYKGAWTARCNAPGTPFFSVPLTLLVTAATSMRLDADDPGLFVLTWASQTGRVYHLSSGTELTDGGDWVGVPGFTNMDGNGNFMSYTGVLESVPVKFFRIQEQMP